MEGLDRAVSFCDEEDNINPNFPRMDWEKDFSQTGSVTIVRVEITFPTTADMETIINMGFQEGFTSGLSNLDQYLGAQVSG